MRTVTFTGPGGNEVIHLEERPDPAPGTHGVVVAVEYAGVNPADVMQRNGNYPAPDGYPPDVPGLEVAGRVVACGDGVTCWRVGDRVFGLVGGGGLAERVMAHERCLAAIPDAIADLEAAAVPEVFATAHDAIAQAGVGAGDVVLVHGAAGGVGSAAIQIALVRGARALGSVRSAKAAAAVTGLGGEPVADDAFAEEVLEKTAGRGADVILEMVGAPHFPSNVDALASRGRIVVVGVGAGDRADVPLLQLMFKRGSVMGTALRTRPLEEKALAIRGFEHEIVPGLASGRLKPVIDSVFGAEEVRSAFARVEGPGKTGKVLVAFTDGRHGVPAPTFERR